MPNDMRVLACVACRFAFPFRHPPCLAFPSWLTHRHLRPEFTDNAPLTSPSSLGPARCGKTHSLSSADTAKSCNPPAGAVGRGLWLAPTSRSAAAVREQLLGGELAACLDPGVTTFDALADAGARGRCPTRRARSRRSSNACCCGASIDAALDGRATEVPGRRRPPLVVRRPARRAHSRAQAARHHAGRFRPLDRHRAAIRGNTKSWPSSTPSTNGCSTSTGSCDDEGRHWAVRDALAGNRRAASPICELVVADGFTDFTHTQLEILGAARPASRPAARFRCPDEAESRTSGRATSCSPNPPPRSPS